MLRISVENFLVAAHWAIQDIQGGLEMWIVWNCKWALVVAFTFIRLDFEILVDGYTVEIWTQSPIQLGWSLSHNSVFVHNWVWLYGGNMISITHSIGLEFQPQLCIHLYFSGHQDQSKFIPTRGNPGKSRAEVLCECLWLTSTFTALVEQVTWPGGFKSRGYLICFSFQFFWILRLDFNMGYRWKQVYHPFHVK